MASKMISPKYAALGLLVVQNASVSMLTRLSREKISSASSTTLYNPSAAVFVAEIIKFIVSLGMLVLDQSGVKEQEKQSRKARSNDRGDGPIMLARQAMINLVTAQRNEVIKLSIPAALYAAQNTLLYFALSNLDAATYQTTYQLKLLSSALFSVLFFNRSLSLVKWFSLFLLTAGVAIVQLEGVTTSSNGSSNGEDKVVGLVAILAACITSGLAGGYFEYVLKSSSPGPGTSSSQKAENVKEKLNSIARQRTTPSLWTRNLQLSIPSLSFSLLFLLLSPPSFTSSPFSQLLNLFDGFSPLVWSVVFNQAIGGLLVAMVIREADGVAKGFATSIAIIVSTISSSIFYSVLPGTMFLAGASLVILSTVIYARDDQTIKSKANVGKKAQ